MNRKYLILLSGALLLVMAGCQAQDTEPPMDPTVTVETAAAQTGNLSTQSTYIGTISAEGTASVVSMVSGNVEQVTVSVGDTVSAGDLLCRFDDESARLSLQNAQAAVNSARESYNSAVSGYGGDDLSVLREQLRMAQNNYDAMSALLETGGAAQVEVDQAYQSLLGAQAALESAQATLNSAQAGIQSAQVGVESAQYQLSLYNLTSPISGVVEAVNITENNFTPSGQVAFIISNGSNKTVTFYVTEEVRQQLKVGQAVSVASGGGTYSGAVTEVSGVVDSSTGLFRVKAIIEGAQALPDGLSVSLTTVTHQEEGAVIVPVDALYFSGGEAYVYVMEDGKAVRADVELALYTTEEAAVSGLPEGTQVITTWSATLRDGAPVQLTADTSGDAQADEGE